MSVFLDYSAYYNLLYKDKDYNSEANYIFDLIKKFSPNTKTVLELGSGTGKHAKILGQKGLKIHGIDISQTMLDEAQKLKDDNLFFEIGDVRTFRAGKKFDAVISLFHVASYQTNNDDLRKYFATVSEHLNQGQIFIFDFWYGPAVLSQKPESRVKIIEDEFLTITRKATPVSNYNDNTVDVNYDIVVLDKKNQSEKQIHESHKMRYFFKPELEFIMESSGFKLLHSEEWLTKKETGPNSWSVCIIGVKE